MLKKLSTKKYSFILKLIIVVLVFSFTKSNLSTKIAYAQGSQATYQGYNPPTSSSDTYNNTTTNNNNTNNNQQSNTNGSQNSNTGNQNNSGVQSNGTNAAPLIYKTSPNYVKAGSTGVTVNVIGSNFITSSIIRINGSDRSTTFISSNQLSAKLNDSDITTYGHYPITVFTPAPGGGISNSISFIVNDGTPVPSQDVNTNGVSFVNGTGNSLATTEGTNGTTSNTDTTNNTNTSNGKNLTASASNGIKFFPWGFLLWILLFIVILFGMIIWRQHYLKKKEEEESKDGDMLNDILVGRTITYNKEDVKKEIYSVIELPNQDNDYKYVFKQKDGNTLTLDEDQLVKMLKDGTIELVPYLEYFDENNEKNDKDKNEDSSEAPLPENLGGVEIPFSPNE